MNSKYFLTVILVLFTFLSACDEKSGDKKVTHLTVKEAEPLSTGKIMQLSLKDNETLQLSLTVIPEDAVNKSVKYSNKYAELMSVSESGLITGKNPGTDTLTIEANDGSGVKVSYRVNIIDHRVKATGITVSAEGRNMVLKIGRPPYDLAAQVTVTPADTYNKTLKYVSSDESIVTVGINSGIVTPVSVGTATISITTTDGTNIEQICNVSVQNLILYWEDAVRTGWTVTSQALRADGTNYDYAVDGSTGLPEHVLTEPVPPSTSWAEYVAFIKPGNTYNSIATSRDLPFPYFTVDMKQQRVFNYIVWRHRNNNSYQYLRMYAVNLFGSNDGTNFEPINTEGMVWIPNVSGYIGGASVADNNFYRIDIPESNYRHVRVQLAMWSNIYNGEHPDYPGAQTSAGIAGNTVHCAHFNVGYSWWE